MKRTWSTKKLGEICKFEGGKQPPKKYFIEHPKEGYVRLLQIRDFESDEKAVYIPKKLAQNWVNEDDVLISRYGGSGNYKSFFNILTGKSGAFNVALIKVIPDEKVINKRFLYYQLQLPKYKIQLIKKSDRAVQSGFRRADLERLEIFIPPLSVQQKIVERLDAIKKAQELNDKQIILAEEPFQSLLHRELDPRGKNWEVKTLEDVAEFLDNQRVPLSEEERAKRKGPYPYYGATGILDWIDDYIFDGEYVLLAEDGGPFFEKNKPVAYRVSGKCWVNNHAHVLAAKDLIDVDFLGYTLMFMDVSQYLTGSTRPKLNKSRAEKIKIPLPPLETQKKIVEKLSAVQEYKKKLIEQRLRWQELFESVLHKSMSGELI